MVSNGLALPRPRRLYLAATCPCENFAMGMRELLVGAILLGGAAGYVWSLPDAPVAALRKIPAEQRPPAAALTDFPPTADDAEADSAWSSGGPPSESGSAGARQAVEQSVSYSGCNEVRALGKAPLRAGQPGYRTDMDGDLDGIACEPIRS
ncbi:MAG: excalibur calcium-binding domain-containing protein [Sphingomonas sp.]|nr:excalibur calcium-binding domain-containing protein [Sphingomonas sp.]